MKKKKSLKKKYSRDRRGRVSIICYLTLCICVHVLGKEVGSVRLASSEGEDSLR